MDTGAKYSKKIPENEMISKKYIFGNVFAKTTNKEETAMGNRETIEQTRKIIAPLLKIKLILL